MSSEIKKLNKDLYKIACVFCGGVNNLEMFPLRSPDGVTGYIYSCCVIDGGWVLDAQLRTKDTTIKFTGEGERDAKETSAKEWEDLEEGEKEKFIKKISDNKDAMLKKV